MRVSVSTRSGPLLNRIGLAYSVVKIYRLKDFGIIRVYTINVKACIYNVRSRA